MRSTRRRTGVGRVVRSHEKGGSDYQSKDKKAVEMKGFISGLLLASVVSPVFAGGYEEHVELAATVESVGVALQVNPEWCDKGGFMGAYVSYKSGEQVMVICQEKRVKGSRAAVEWTAEDLDTLRHESQHLIQDCGDGKIDGELVPVYKTPVAFARSVLGPQRMAEIARAYNELGGEVIVLEYEAFAVADLNDPLEQSRDILKYCM